MRTLLVSALLGVPFCGPAPADDPPKKLTPAELKALVDRLLAGNKAGAEHFQSGKYDEAAKAFEEALGAARALLPPDRFPKGHPDLATAIHNLAMAKMHQGAREQAEAEALFREELEMNRRLFPKQDHDDVAQNLRMLAEVLQARGKLAEADTTFADALAMLKRLYPKQDRADVASALNNRASALTALGTPAKAEPLFREALAMNRGVYGNGPHRDVASNLNNLAGALSQLAKFPEAEKCHREALAMRRALFPKRDHPEIAQSLNNLGLLLQDLGRLDEAEKAVREALEMDRRLFGKRDHADFATSLSSLAEILRVAGKFAEAGAYYDDSLAMRKRLAGNADDLHLAEGMNNLAGFRSELGRASEAERLFRDSLAMRRRLFPGQDHPAVAKALGNLATELGRRGNLAEAEALARESLAMWKRLHPDQDHPELARNTDHLGVLLSHRGKFAEADGFVRAALEMRQRLFPGRDHPDVATSLNNVASVLIDLVNVADAEVYYRRALEMRKRLFPNQDHPDVAGSLSNLGTTLSYRRQWAEAERLGREALEMKSRLFPNQDHPDVAVSMANLAAVLSHRGKSAEAEKLYRDALAMNRRLYGDAPHPAVAGSLNNLAGALCEQGRFRDADPLFREALAVYRDLTASHVQSLPEGEALEMLGVFPLTHDAFLSNARVLGSDPATVYPEVWSFKGRVARVVEGRHLAARAAATNPRAAAVLADLADRRRRRAELILAPIAQDPPTRKARDDEIRQLTDRIKELEAKLSPLRSEWLGKAGPDELQAALPDDAAFIDLRAYDFFDHDPKNPGAAEEKAAARYLAFVVTRDRVSWVDLGPAEAIDDAVAEWRKAITAPAARVPDAVPARVRDLLWTKLRKELPKGIEVLYVSPDLGLTRVPWAAIPQESGKLVLEEFAVATVPHGTFLLDVLKPGKGRPAGPNRLLAVGGVAFGEAVKPGANLPAPPEPPPLKSGQKLSWPDLPAAAGEARHVADRAARRKLESRLLGGADASCDRVLAELAGARFAHLATHGFFADAEFRSVLQLDPRRFEKGRVGERVGAGALNPLVMSGLAFAGANRPETPGRGLVTGEHLVDRDLSNLELAVLSACDAGLGDVAGGEGVFGLQRAFHVAGAKNVVAGLWKVPDAATAALMGEFYRQLWDNNLPPVRALQQAQLALYRAKPEQFREMALRGPGAGDKDFDRVIAKAPIAADGKNPPVVWAAFTLSGPGR